MERAGYGPIQPTVVEEWFIDQFGVALALMGCSQPSIGASPKGTRLWQLLNLVPVRFDQMDQTKHAKQDRPAGPWRPVGAEKT